MAIYRIEEDKGTLTRAGGKFVFKLENHRFEMMLKFDPYDPLALFPNAKTRLVQVSFDYMTEIMTIKFLSLVVRAGGCQRLLLPEQVCTVEIANHNDLIAL